MADNIGEIVQIIGPVIDIHFERRLPKLYSAISSVPAPISAQPIRLFAVNCSWRNTKAFS